MHCMVVLSTTVNGCIDLSNGELTGLVRPTLDVVAIEPSHKSHNALDKYCMIHYFIFKKKCAHVCTFLLQNVAMWVWDWCIVGFVLQVYMLEIRVSSSVISSTIVRQKYGIVSWSVFWGIYNVLLLIMLHHGVSVQKSLGDKFSPSGKKIIHGFVFLVWHRWHFFSLIKENLFLSICATIFMV